MTSHCRNRYTKQFPSLCFLPSKKHAWAEFEYHIPSTSFLSSSAISVRQSTPTGSLFLMSLVHLPLSTAMLVSRPCLSYPLLCGISTPLCLGSSSHSSLQFHSKCTFLVTFSFTPHDVPVPDNYVLPLVSSTKPTTSTGPLVFVELLILYTLVTPHSHHNIFVSAIIFSSYFNLFTRSTARRISFLLFFHSQQAYKQGSPEYHRRASAGSHYGIWVTTSSKR